MSASMQAEFRWGETRASSDERNLSAKFAEFHRDNPRVYQEIVRLARRARARGHKRMGMKMLWEVVRWRMTVETSDPDFKLNNNYTSRYARLVMNRERDLAGFFETRALKAE